MESTAPYVLSAALTLFVIEELCLWQTPLLSPDVLPCEQNGEVGGRVPLLPYSLSANFVVVRSLSGCRLIASHVLGLLLLA